MQYAAGHMTVPLRDALPLATKVIALETRKVFRPHRKPGQCIFNWMAMRFILESWMMLSWLLSIENALLKKPDGHTTAT